MVLIFETPTTNKTTQEDLTRKEIMSKTPNKTAASQRRHRGRRNTRGRASAGSSGLRHGQVSKDVSVPKVSAPKSKKASRKRDRNERPPSTTPRIGVGCIILRGDQILLVRERGRWSLPKGGLESGEMVQDGARRETFEETGLVVKLRELAFIVEFRSETWGHHLEFFYTGREIDGELAPRDPDRDVQEARFIPLSQIRDFLRFRPRLLSLETWLKDKERRVRHFVFNLDEEPAMLAKRRRVTSSQRRSSRGSGGDSGGGSGDSDVPAHHDDSRDSLQNGSRNTKKSNSNDNNDNEDFEI